MYYHRPFQAVTNAEHRIQGEPPEVTQVVTDRVGCECSE